MKSFLVVHSYLMQIVRDGRQKVASTLTATLVTVENVNKTSTNRVPMALTYHPKNLSVRTILRSVTILQNDNSIEAIFSQLPLTTYRRARNLKDLVVRSDLPAENLPRQPGTFPYRRTICRTRPYINPLTSIRTPGGVRTITRHLTYGQRTSSTASHVINALKRFMLVRQDVDWLIASGNIASTFCTGRGDLPVAQQFNSAGHSLDDILVAVVKVDFTAKQGDAAHLQIPYTCSFWDKP